mmetsp:Transcript_4308/g.9700  ORF Transcript_4308/g.9700 Transcript_4308/m.9700 type:complete len:82 (+) Transcript_4308:1279-1524(+)
MPCQPFSPALFLLYYTIDDDNEHPVQERNRSPPKPGGMNAPKTNNPWQRFVTNLHTGRGHTGTPTEDGTIESRKIPAEVFL